MGDGGLGDDEKGWNGPETGSEIWVACGGSFPFTIRRVVGRSLSLLTQKVCSQSVVSPRRHHPTQPDLACSTHPTSSQSIHPTPPHPTRLHPIGPKASHYVGTWAGQGVMG